MASTTKLTKAAQWWKHLKEYKRTFWKAERKNWKAALRKGGPGTKEL
jgi:hypothetical protein